MTQKELNIGSAAVYKIIHEELQMKSSFVVRSPLNLTEHQKADFVRINNETLKLLNDDGQCIISKIITGGKMYIPFFDVPTDQ